MKVFCSGWVRLKRLLSKRESQYCLKNIWKDWNRQQIFLNLARAVNVDFQGKGCCRILQVRVLSSQIMVY